MLKSEKEFKMTELRELARYSDRYRAHIVRCLLEQYSIPSFIMADDQGGLRPHLTITSPARLMVPEQELNRAKSIIEDNEEQAKDHEPKKAKVNYASICIRAAIISLVFPVPLLMTIISMIHGWKALKAPNQTNHQKGKLLIAALLNVMYISVTIWLILFGLKPL